MTLKILVVDVGGTNVKAIATGVEARRKFASGSKLTPERMVAGVKALAAEWQYDVVSVGYPGPLVRQRIAAEPHNLGSGWAGFDFAAAFGCPVKLINDAAMQALGGYRGGKMLFLGFGTGLGTTLIEGGVVEAMELGHAPYKKHTFEDYVGAAALKRMGKKRWRGHALDVIAHFREVMQPDDILLGGGNTKKITTLTEGCRRGHNSDAFTGGFRLWGSEPLQ